MHRRDAPRSGQLTVSACLRWQMTPPNNHRSFYAHDLWNIKYLHRFKRHGWSENVVRPVQGQRPVRPPGGSHGSGRSYWP